MQGVAASGFASETERRRLELGEKGVAASGFASESARSLLSLSQPKTSFPYTVSFVFLINWYSIKILNCIDFDLNFAFVVAVFGSI